MNVCADCFTALSKDNRVSRFALANNLYRGEFPKYFEDLTWVEEKICAIYSITAHVTRLFQSSDPLQPKVFHGNICAHDMNVVSTASVLPRTPADINGFLSIIFVGPGKFKPDQMGPMFRVWNEKNWSFLVWLKHHNCLYSDVLLEPNNLMLYPADGLKTMSSMSKESLKRKLLDFKNIQLIF
ncbi:hypothetical protein BDR07DRAFT_1453399 [Suillus spraguei]|nr:hypothetical protein BDR07DRAFT_1453399 [Suillus spraguei]